MALLSLHREGSTKKDLQKITLCPCCSGESVSQRYTILPSSNKCGWFYSNFHLYKRITSVCSPTVCQSWVLECSSLVELHMKVSNHLSIRRGRLYAHQGVPPCAGGLVHSQCVDWLWAQEWLCQRAYMLAHSLAFCC